MMNVSIAPPAPGDLFRVRGEDRYLTVALVDVALASERGTTRYTVYADTGARWALLPKDDTVDGVRFTGTAAP